MDLNRLSIRARQRNSWEAVDLGFLMARAWWKPLCLSWLLPSCVVFALLAVPLYRHPIIVFLLTWWLTPLWDRYPLYIASRAMFGERVSLRAAFHASKTQLKKDVLPALLWQRLSISRAFDLPVTVLEGSRGVQRRQRLALLHQTVGSTAAWLTLACLAGEIIFTLGTTGLVWLMIPESITPDFNDVLHDNPQSILWVYCIVLHLARALVAPFYIAAGFALYISRRIDLEGWDIEVRFRHIARLRPAGGQYGERALKATAVNIAVLIAVYSSFAVPITALAQTQSDEQRLLKTPAESQQLIDKVLEGSDFVRQKDISGWRLKNDETQGEALTPEWFIEFIEFLENLFDTSDNGLSTLEKIKLWGKILEFSLWALAALFSFYLLYRYRDTLRTLLEDKPSAEGRQPPAPEVLFGLDVRREAIPERVAEEVLKLWQSNHHRQALNLLYRATLSGLMHQYHFKLKEGDTEQECADRVQAASAPALREFVIDLTRVWQQLAYGHHPPGSETVNQLCKRWQPLFAESDQPVNRYSQSNDLKRGGADSEV